MAHGARSKIDAGCAATSTVSRLKIPTPWHLSRLPHSIFSASKTFHASPRAACIPVKGVTIQLQIPNIRHTACLVSDLSAMAPRRLLGTSVVVVAMLVALLPQTQPFVLRSSVHSAGGRAARRASTSVNINMRSERPSELAGMGRASFLRAALGSAAALATVVSTSKPAPAFDIPLPFANDNPELEKVVKVADCLRFVRKLEQDLKAGALKGGPEDSAVVSRALEVYLKPMQESMKEVAPVMELAGREARERARLLPSIMLGHLLELEMACGTKNAKEQLQEVEEVRETLDEFIALAKTRYEIKTPEFEAPDGDQLGIFGCSFYGMKRTDESSLCQPDP